MTIECARLRAWPAASSGDNQIGPGSKRCDRGTLMRLRERISGYMRLPIKRILVLIAVLLFTFPRILTAQEPRLPCNDGLGDSDLSSASCDPNEIASGLDDAAGTSNLPVRATNRGDNDWVCAWMRKVDKVRASQPHFVSPIITTHVTLVQQFRYDMSWQQDPGGTATSNYGMSKGLEIIPLNQLDGDKFRTNYF